MKTLSQKDVDILLNVSAGEDFHRPCGFCGSTKTKLSNGPSICYVYCENCMAQGPVAEDPKAAWIKWNIRNDDYE